MSRLLPTALVVVSLLALAGCGSGGSSTGEAKAPKGASAAVRHLYGAFPPPRTGSMEPSVARAVEAGEAACRGKTPLAVKDEFFRAAKGNLEPQQATMIGRVADFEAHEVTETGFVAGQLAADTYAATLSAVTAQAGYQGCIHSLAEQLERKLAPARG
jgi:hypothetical protein